jgi:hypothetical protein
MSNVLLESSKEVGFQNIDDGLALPAIYCGRWRIIKTGVRLHETQDVDDVMRMCCSLHNWLLEADGRNAVWEQGINVNDYLEELFMCLPFFRM